MKQNDSSIPMKFELLIRRPHADEYGSAYPHVIHFTVIEKVNAKSSFYDELNRIGKKYSIGEYITFVLLNGKDLLFSDLFSSDIIEIIDCDLFYDPLPLKVESGKLIDQYNLWNKTVLLGINGPERGKVVGVTEGIKFEFHPGESNRHHCKHIHCTYGETESVIDLEKLQFIHNNFNRSKAKAALRFVKNNQKELIDYWDRFVVKGELVKLRFDL